MAMKKRNALIGAVAIGAVGIIGGHEGLRTTAYKPVPTDPWTICYGSTTGVKAGDKMTVPQCNALLDKELQHYNSPYESLSFDLTPAQHIAFLDTTYNIGIGATQKSTFYRLLKDGKVREACDGLLAWKFVAGRDCSKGSYCKGVWNRRVEMSKMCKGEVPVEQVLMKVNYNYGKNYLPDGATSKP